jgi:hypothetical protein
MMVAVNKCLGRVEEIKRAMIKKPKTGENATTKPISSLVTYIWSRSRFFLLFFYIFGI